MGGGGGGREGKREGSCVSAFSSQSFILVVSGIVDISFRMLVFVVES